MRLLLDGASLAGSPRLRNAGLGLAIRGHEVFWNGEGLAAARGQAPVIEARTGAPDGRPVDAVIGSGRPFPLAHRGWFARASCLVAGVAAGEVARWGALDRWAWQSLAGFALIEPAEAAVLQESPGPIVLGRAGLWSDEPPMPAPLAEHPDTEILERACERIRARHRSGAPGRAAFLDRDGTLIEETGYLSDPDALRLLPGVPPALARLRAAGYALIVISNQAGVGRGYYPLAGAHATMAALRRRLRAHGVELDAIYLCPHAPDDGCACRKPGIELFERASDDHGLSMRSSVMIGDKAIDVIAGRRAGCRAVLVETGYGSEEKARFAGAERDERPDAILPDLAAAADWVLEGGEPD